MENSSGLFIPVTQSSATCCNNKRKVPMSCSAWHSDIVINSWHNRASTNHRSPPLWLRSQSQKQILKRKAFSGFQVCVGISCVRLTRDRLHAQSVWWPVPQQASSGFDCNTKSFHITSIFALPMAVRSCNLNPQVTTGMLNDTKFQQVRKIIQFTQIKSQCSAPPNRSSKHSLQC